MKQTIETVYQAAYELYKKKNEAYGDSFKLSIDKYGAVVPLIRIGDKFNRLENLILNPDINDLGESIEDTLIDLANYALMTADYLRTNHHHSNANKSEE